MITEVKLHLNEFDDCDIGVSTDITFCLKELRVCLFYEHFKIWLFMFFSIYQFYKLSFFKLPLMWKILT